MNASSVYFKGYVTILVLAGLFALLAIPLILSKIPRNIIYGYRTARTMKSDAVWYAANAFFGWALIASSIVTTMTMTILYFTANLAPNHYMNTSIVALVAPLAVAIWLTHLRIRTLDEEP